MFPTLFFRFFWLLYLGIFGLLSLTLVLETYVAIRRTDPFSLLTAAILTLMSLALCEKARESFQAAGVRR